MTTINLTAPLINPFPKRTPLVFLMSFFFKSFLFADVFTLFCAYTRHPSSPSAPTTSFPFPTLFRSSMAWLQDVALLLSPGQPLYVMLYAVAIIFFCFFYTALVFNPRDTADNLKKSGAFIPGIRPGEQTSRYIDKVMPRLTLAGALYITFICLVPEFMLIAWNVPFYFGGTSLLIIVVVIMDFMAQVQTHLMSSQYESVLKKANLKGYGR